MITPWFPSLTIVFDAIHFVTLSLSTLQLQDLQLNLEREIQEKELLQAKNFKLKNELAEHERLKKLLKKLELAKDKLQREYDEYKVSTPAIVNVAWWDWMLVHCLGSLEEQSITLSSLCSIILQLLVCQRDCIDIEKFLGIIFLSFLLDACTWECWLVLSLFVSQHLMIFHRVLNTCGTLSHFEIILLYTFPLEWTFSMCSTLIQQFSFSLLTTKHVPAFSDSYFKPTIVRNIYISQFTWD